MPLLKFNILEGRTDNEIAMLLDASHEVVLKALRVPDRDRYQVVNEYKASRTRIEDTGLGIPRTGKIVVLEVVSRKRTIEEKQIFYRLLAEALSTKCGTEPNDVMVTFVENADADWSFGHGEAQFLTGKLG